MLIRRRGRHDVESSEITPEGVYLDRRRFIARSTQIGLAAALAPAALLGCDGSGGSANAAPLAGIGGAGQPGQEVDWSKVLSELDEKLTSIAHEMYHMSPRFDGDLRRFAGGKPYHTGSQRRYDAAMSRIAASYAQRTTRPELHAFLRHSYSELLEAHGAVVGLRMRAPHPRRVR